jgi:hypothetical protein
LGWKRLWSAESYREMGLPKRGRVESHMESQIIPSKKKMAKMKVLKT